MVFYSVSGSETFLMSFLVTRHSSRVTNGLMPESPTTSDTFYHGKVVIQQLKKGYRFAVDSPILADFLQRSRQPALEIGCGVGVVSLLALFKKKFPAVTGVEIQEPLYRLAVDNAAANGMNGKFLVIRGDFKRMYAGLASVRTIFCNPPFFKASQGRVSHDRTIRLARFDIALNLDDLLRCSAAILAPKGSFCLIFPYSRQQELLVSAAGHGLYPEKIRCVQPFADAPPDRFLVRLGKVKKCCCPEKPLVLFKGKGVYTAEMEKILSGG